MNDTVFSDIYQQYFDAMYGYGIGLGFSHDDCIDAIHDVFCHLFEHQSLDNVNNTKYFLFKCLRNKLLNNRRDGNIENKIYLEERHFDIKVSMMDSILAKERQILITQKIESLLNTLTARQREAVYLRYMQEMEYEDIAQMMNMTSDSVKQLVHRAIQSMRKNNPQSIDVI
ncbi:MAG: sigma-70 family RNA polymerase sigma factor [Tannerella sp.]|jgi:RNA polymerase sigma factor (sigma-70 family)|nr:sigma-70 family RNA polymerase sigma factor [Tannerella sp.]